MPQIFSKSSTFLSFSLNTYINDMVIGHSDCLDITLCQKSDRRNQICLFHELLGMSSPLVYLGFCFVLFLASQTRTHRKKTLIFQLQLIWIGMKPKISVFISYWTNLEVERPRMSFFSPLIIMLAKSSLSQYNWFLNYLRKFCCYLFSIIQFLFP